MIKSIQVIWEHIRIPLFIVCALLLFLQIRSCLSKPIKEIATIYNDSVTYYKDASNRMHTQLLLRESDLTVARQAYAKLLADKATELKVKDKFIRNITNFKTVRQVNIDSLLKANTTTTIIGGDTVYTRVPSTVYIPVYDSLSVTQYSKKEGWFKRIPMVDVVSYSDRETIESIQNFKLHDKTPNLTFGPTLTWSVTRNGMKVVPGIGLQWNLIGIHIGK